MQFFPDIPAAIQELRRVLSPKGRFAFTIWCPISENPYFAALANALERHLSEQAANGLRGAFAKSFAADFEQPLTQAGFKSIAVASLRLDFHLPPLADYLPGHLASLPMASAISALPASKQTAILEEVKLGLQPYDEGDGFTIPSRSELVSVGM